MGEPMDVENDVLDFKGFELFDVRTLLEKFDKGTATYSDIAKNWKQLVPDLLCPTPSTFSLESSSKDNAVHNFLLKPLEDFICKYDHPDLVKFLSSINNAPPVCGRLFKIGEPTYYCRQCAMDPTCVLCVECFISSTHKHHKYKMRTSSGGGCCDCGDEEAWKSNACCESHRLSFQSVQNNLLPDDFIARSRLIFLSVLHYAYKLLTVDSLTVPFEFALEPEGFEYCNDNYCTVLYNDEIHTFDQVITTLTRVIKCSQKDAIEYVTNIDREGRAIVKCSSFKVCSDLKSDIEKYTSRHGTKPLKVLVIQSQMIAHQAFAMKLLSWLQTLLKPSMRLRQLFADVVTQNNGEMYPPFLEGILVRDSFLWKSARLHWHRLFITGMLMDYENKKIFATIFTKNYAVILKDFINDDHEHSFSVASLSVQIYTVPTLTHYLIEKEEVLFIIMNTFLLECAKKRNLQDKLVFERNIPNGKLRRAIYSLYDIRYLLSYVPTEMTDSLRNGIIFGFTLIINLLSQMQGMDSVTRQVGQHMEYEPEWESAFNLHIKLAPIITLMLKWCSSDNYLLMRACRHVHTKLCEDSDYPAYENVSLNNFTACVIYYDVASQPVSIHLPVSRFFAGLSVNIAKLGLSFSELFNKSIPYEPILLIEPVLRTRVMIAQVHAGMWRRNGYSLSNQIYFYNNVKCRGEMLDKDIIFLQLGATLIPSHEFILNMLYKFNLMSWAKQDFEKASLKNTISSEEESIRQTIHLVEELLLLLITIIGERYVPGVGEVTEDDCLKREIIQQLCIKPMSHSELDKTLPDDIHHETGMEDVIDEVAVFKRPGQGTSKGYYELKPKFAEKYNVFFYHYTREELSKSEENQRKYNKATIGLECCPPPKLPPFTNLFKKVNDLLTCDVMLYIIKIVLERCLNFCARSFSEPQVHKVLHLIGYALNEEEMGQLSESFTVKASHKDINLPVLLEKIINNPRVEAHKDLIKWTLHKFMAVSKRGVNEDKSLPIEYTPIEKEEKESRSKLAAERKAKIMAQMAAMQKTFMKDNPQYFVESMITSDGATPSSFTDAGPSNHIALGPNQSPVTVQTKSFICILCQEEQEVAADGPSLVFAAFVQQSTVLCRDRSIDLSSLKMGGFNLKFNKFLSPNIGPGPHTSTCGHVMHRACWRRYCDNVINKESRRPYRLRQPSSFDVEKQEYLCPLCECLSNTIIPILPMMSSLPNLKSEETLKGISFNDWVNASLEAFKDSKNSKELAMYMTSNPTVTEATFTALDPPSNSDVVISSSSDEEDSPYSAEPTISTFDGIQNIGQVTLPPPILHDIFYHLMEEETQAPQSNAVSSSSNEEPVGTPHTANTVQHYSGVDRNAPAFTLARIQDYSEEEVVFKPILSLNIIEMVLLYAQSTYTKSYGVFPQDDDPIVPLTAWQSCTYTIHALEQYLRINNKPLFGDMSSRQRDCLEALIRLSGVLGAAWKDSCAINQQGAKILEFVIDNNKENFPTILDWDSFNLLVTLTCSLSSMFSTTPVPVPTGTTLELNVFTLMLYSMIAQIMLCADFSPEDSETKSIHKDTDCLLKYLSIIDKDIKCNNSATFWKHIKSECMPFLRCSALFYSFLTDVTAPDELMQPGGDTFENICSYLGVPSTCNQLLDNQSFSALLTKWTGRLRDSDQSLIPQKQKKLKNVSLTNCLVALPDDYSDLINTVSLFTCPNSDREDSRNPTMCLVCGEMLCSQTYCCQTELNKALVGACNYHSYSCGAGVGIFLRIRECEILLLATPNRGSFSTPPYLDEHGEPDPGLNRGNPLRLCRERYKKLQMMWLSHSIYEEIARSIETSSSPLNTQWQHL